MPSLVGTAALNNALWCDAVGAAHGAAGQFLDSIWVRRGVALRFYPDAVTLADGAATRGQEQAIDALIRSARRPWSVKDSFACLDLGRLGFSVLFDAQWIAMPLPESPPKARPALKWARIDTPGELRRWERAWAGSGASPDQPPMFPPQLLSDPDVAFLAGVRNDAAVGGAILNRGAGAVGLTNLFSRESGDIALEGLWRDLIAQAAALFPGLPLVGYEQAAELAPALRAGLAPIGPLRVWALPFPADGGLGAR